MKRIVVIVLIACWAVPVLSQEWKAVPTEDFKAVLLKCSEIYKADNYVLTVENKLYRDVANPSDAIVQKGIFAHGTGKEYRSQQASQVIIQTSEIKLVIDTASKVVGMLYPDTLFNTLNVASMLQDEHWDAIQCAVKNDKDLVCYSITGVPGFQALEFRIHRKTDQLRELIATLPADNYVSEQLDDQTTEQPRSELNYSAPSKLTPADKKQLFNISEWVRAKGSTYELTTGHADYTLEDLRYTTR